MRNNSSKQCTLTKVAFRGEIFAKYSVKPTHFDENCFFVALTKNLPFGIKNTLHFLYHITNPHFTLRHPKSSKFENDKELMRTDPEPTRNRPGTDSEPTRNRPGTDPEPTYNPPGTHPIWTLSHLVPDFVTPCTQPCHT